jgi:hypothetical protein
MAGRKKSFVPPEVDRGDAAAPVRQTSAPIGPGETTVRLPRTSSSRKSFDFAPFYECGFDDITAKCQAVIEHMILAGTPNQETVSGYCASVAYFLSFCREKVALTGGPLLTDGIDRCFLVKFLDFLRRQTSRNGSAWTYRRQKTVYTNTKSVLLACGRRQWLAAPEAVFPRNPFPRSNRRVQQAKALSNGERERFAVALKADVASVLDGRFDGPDSHGMGLCLLAIALRTGRNTTPLLELGRNALVAHPLKEDRRLLVTHKRRGNATHLTPLRFSKDIEAMETIGLDVANIYEAVLARTEPLVDAAPLSLRSHLWLYRSNGNTTKGGVSVLRNSTLLQSVAAFVERHDLRGDDGESLRINVSRLRQTFTNRLWRLSGGDPFLVAKLAGHSVKVLDSHYLDVTPEMERNHKFVGEALVDTYFGRPAKALPVAPTGRPKVAEQTCVGRCADNFNGECAPKNGTRCIDFLSCFRCRSFVVTADDLHRLFSFYWLLVSERALIGAAKWAKYYGWIIRAIDQDISPRFDQATTAAARDQARANPHPFWRSRAFLGTQA